MRKHVKSKKTFHVRSINILETHKAFIELNNLNLSSLVRGLLDSLIEEDRLEKIKTGKVG